MRERPEKQGTGDARYKAYIHNASLSAASGQARKVMQETELIVDGFAACGPPMPAASRKAFMLPPS
jgi:hypothetical protein